MKTVQQNSPDGLLAELRSTARRVGDADLSPRRALPPIAASEAPRVADALLELLNDADVNVRIGTADILQVETTLLRDLFSSNHLRLLTAAVARLCDDQSLNDYVYGSQLDELEIRTVADSARAALRSLQGIIREKHPAMSPTTMSGASGAG